MSEKEKTNPSSYQQPPYQQPYQPPSYQQPYPPTYPPSYPPTYQQPYPPTYPTPYPPTYPQPYPPGYNYPYYTDNLDLPNGEIKGYYKAWVEDADRDPNRVIEHKMDWFVCCEWSFTGRAVIAFGGVFHLTGVAESIGPDNNTPDEVKLFEKDVDVSDAEPDKTRSYKLEVKIPANVIPSDGAYKVVVLLTHSIKGKSGKEHFTRLAGIVEIPMLQFYSFEE